MSILILGNGKTGTTGLYKSIKEAVRGSDDWYFLFEPTTPVPIRALSRYAPDRPILTKVMIHRARACELDPAAFSQRILVVRDPRDILVSRLLFMPLIRGAVRTARPDDLSRFLDALREKEADPSSWSVHGLYELAGEAGLGAAGFGSFVRTLDQTAQIDREESYFTSRYEDFVDGRLDALSEYLGFEVANREVADGSWLAHITRSKGYGDWRHWFRGDDIDYFRPLVGGYMDHFGYSDWDLADDQKIDPDVSSAYIERKLTERVSQVESRHGRRWTVRSVADEDEVASMREMAEDGDPVSAQRLALIYRSGHLVDRDLDEARRWAEHGAIQGHPGSMELLADLLERGSGQDAHDPAWWRDAAAAEAAEAEQAKQRRSGSGSGPTRPRSGRERRRIRQLERELEELRGSVRYQVGDALVDSFLRPRAALRLPSRLYSIYRSRRPKAGMGAAAPRPS